MSDANLIVVHEFGTEAEAIIAKGALDSAGIDSMLEADTAGRMRQHLAWSGAGFKILVREEDAADAHAILGAKAFPAQDPLT